MRVPLLVKVRVLQRNSQQEIHICKEVEYEELAHKCMPPDLPLVHMLEAEESLVSWCNSSPSQRPENQGS